MSLLKKTNVKFYLIESMSQSGGFLYMHLFRVGIYLNKHSLFNFLSLKSRKIKNYTSSLYTSTLLVNITA